MFLILNSLYKSFALHGLVLDLFVSGTIALCIVLSVVLIGRLIDMFEIFLLRIICYFFGAKFALFTCNRLTFLGVIAHELSHALLIFLTGGRVVGIHLFEFRRDGRLGHVDFQTLGSRKQRLIQLAMGSCAPVLLGIFNTFIVWKFIQSHMFGVGWTIFLWYLLVSIICHMSMSKEDLKNYFRGLSYVFPAIWSICMLIQYCFYK